MGMNFAIKSSVVFGKPIRTEIGSGIFSSGSVQNGSEPFSSKMLHKQKKDIKKCSSTLKPLLKLLEPVQSRTETNWFRTEISVQFQFNRRPITSLPSNSVFLFLFFWKLFMETGKLVFLRGEIQFQYSRVLNNSSGTLINFGTFFPSNQAY